mgnify:FL=1
MTLLASFESDAGVAAIHRFYAPQSISGPMVASAPQVRPLAPCAFFKVIFFERPATPPQQRFEVIRCETEGETLDVVADILPGAKEVAA